MTTNFWTTCSDELFDSILSDRTIEDLRAIYSLLRDEAEENGMSRDEFRNTVQDLYMDMDPSLDGEALSYIICARTAAQMAYDLRLMEEAEDAMRERAIELQNDARESIDTPRYSDIL